MSLSRSRDLKIAGVTPAQRIAMPETQAQCLNKAEVATAEQTSGKMMKATLQRRKTLIHSKSAVEV
jgi:hypothetical protein